MMTEEEIVQRIEDKKRQLLDVNSELMRMMAKCPHPEYAVVEDIDGPECGVCGTILDE